MRLLLFFFGLLSFITTLTTSCSRYTGHISSNYNGKLPNEIKTFTGESSATYVLGIGGNYHQGLIQEAKENLYYKVRKFDNPRLINLTVDVKRSYYLFFSKTYIYVSAEMLNYYQYDDDIKEEAQKEEQNKQFGFYVGEKVKYKIIGKEKFGKIIKMKKKTALIQSQDLMKREWVPLRFIQKTETNSPKSNKLTF